MRAPSPGPCPLPPLPDTGQGSVYVLESIQQCWHLAATGVPKHVVHQQVFIKHLLYYMPGIVPSAQGTAENKQTKLPFTVEIDKQDELAQDKASRVVLQLWRKSMEVG